MAVYIWGDRSTGFTVLLYGINGNTWYPGTCTSCLLYYYRYRDTALQHSNDKKYFEYLVPASYGNIAEMTIWTSRIYTPVDPMLKHIIWLARKTVMFHLWHDRFEYYYARI